MAQKFQYPLVSRHFCITLLKQEGLAVAESLHQFLQKLLQLCQEQTKLTAFLTSPRVPVKQIKAFMTHVARDAALPEALIGPLMVLAEFHLFTVLKMVIGDLERVINQAKDITDVVCTTATKLDKKTEEQILQDLLKFGVKNPNLETRIDPALLKGYKLTWNHMIYDQTLKKDLDNLYQTLIGAQI